VQYNVDEMHIKIAHFGLSQYISEPPERDVDTSIWRAPEVLQGLKGSTDKAQPYITQASDVYSFGAICYVVLFGRRPSKERMEYIGVRNRDGSINAGFGLELLEYSCYGLVDLIRTCLDPNPDLRPSSRSICEKLPSIIKKIRRKGDDHIQFPIHFASLK
jgi:serine/threonine protein kinase